MLRPPPRASAPPGARPACRLAQPELRSSWCWSCFFSLSESTAGKPALAARLSFMFCIPASPRNVLYLHQQRAGWWQDTCSAGTPVTDRSVSSDWLPTHSTRDQAPRYERQHTGTPFQVREPSCTSYSLVGACFSAADFLSQLATMLWLSSHSPGSEDIAICLYSSCQETNLVSSENSSEGWFSLHARNPTL